LERAAYSVSWYIEGAHFGKVEDIAFKAVAMSCDYLNDLAGATVIFPKYAKNQRSFQLSYKPPAPLIFRSDGLRVELTQDVPLQLSETFHLVERAEVSIKSKVALPFLSWMEVMANLRSLWEFMTERRLRLRYVRAAYGSRRAKWCRILGLRESIREPKQLLDHPVREFLFTARGLAQPSWQRVVTAWTSVRNDLEPVVELYAAATKELQLYAELRFLALAQALETYHRTRFNETRIHPSDHKRRKKRVLASLDSQDLDWVTDAIAWANELTLRERLERLYEKVPRLIIDHLPDRRILVQQIADTRNYLTHFSSRKASVLKGFALWETTDNLRHVLQYFLLIELGFSRNQASDIAYRSFVRDLGRSRVIRSMEGS
jgi:hypothetical protein